MARLASYSADNVVPLRRGHRARPEEIRAPIRDMADAVRSFDGLECCAGLLQAGPLGMADEVAGTDRPIVSFQVQLPHVQRGLDQLAHINVATWPDTHWVLRLSSARTTAALRLRAVTRSLLRTPPGPSTLDGQLAADIRELAAALRRLRLLIIRQYPEALRAP
jgi:hypothetical protein